MCTDLKVTDQPGTHYHLQHHVTIHSVEQESERMVMYGNGVFEGLSCIGEIYNLWLGA